MKTILIPIVVITLMGVIFSLSPITTVLIIAAYFGFFLILEIVVGLLLRRELEGK